jgi:phytanoyl-CoA hydroxylase
MVYRTIDNLGRTVEIPATAEEDHPYFERKDREAYTSYYQQNGYVVVRGAIDLPTCDAANEAFDKEVYPSRDFIYRQTTARAERNAFTPTGFVSNPILNVQSVDPIRYPAFRECGLKVLTAPGVQEICRNLLGEPGKIVQSMYFQGNPSTWPHQDTYYLDSSRLGSMTAAWIATEDIKPGAGRFFVCPGSHKTDMARNGGDFDIAFNHDRYKTLIKDVMLSHQMRIMAPALRKGDVLFWNAATIHGSLPTSEPGSSRRSFTTHWIPESTELMQFQARVRRMKYEDVDGAKVARPKDLAQLQNRAILWLETRFPASFSLAKKIAIKLLLR